MPPIEALPPDLKALARDERWAQLAARPGLLDTICSHVACAGTMEELCEVWEVPFWLVWRWIQADKDRKASYIEANQAGHEYDLQRLDRELRAIAFIDFRTLLGPDHRLKPVDQWPKELGACLAGMDVEELFEMVDGAEQGKKEKAFAGWLKKVKLWDKPTALKLLGQRRSAYVERRQVEGTLTLEQLLAQSWADERTPDDHPTKPA